MKDPNTILIILGFVMIILEIALGAITGFDLLLVGVAFVIGGFIGTTFHSVNLALIIILVFIALYVLVIRSMVKKVLYIKTTKTNTDNIIGQTGVVTKTITADKPGQMKIDGETWRATANRTIKEGEEVKIISVSGVTLTVS
jgi:membrane protein implicated in regulation of membrane protease activity